MCNLLRIQMDQHQQLIGCEVHFLSLPCTQYRYGKKSRMKFLWQSNTKHGVTLKVSNPGIQLPQRENDVFIMDRITATSHPTHILERLNDVRLWLHVSRLSDMVNQSGDKIENWALYGPPESLNMQWPKRRHPLESNLKMWRDVLRRLFCGEKGLHPRNLGKCLSPLRTNVSPVWGPSFREVIDQYPDKYKKLLGGGNIRGDTSTGHN